MPPPEPRSRTVSPARNSATAIGLPHPRLAATAAAGSSACSPAPYNPEPNASGTSSVPQLAGEQHASSSTLSATSPLDTAVAARA